MNLMIEVAGKGMQTYVVSQHAEVGTFDLDVDTYTGNGFRKSQSAICEMDREEMQALADAILRLLELTKEA